MRVIGVVAAIAVTTLVAVRLGSSGPAAQAAPSHPPGYVVDSIHPAEEQLRRFRAGLTAPATLDGPASRDELVTRFLDAVERKDSAALSRLVMNRAEFGFLVYPELSVSRPPYRQPPEIAWMLSATATGAGMTKLLARADQLKPRGYRCAEAPALEGALRLWRGCAVLVHAGNSTKPLRLFGAIIERDGRYKFAGLNNAF